ncbi:LodA/GoxA family CTQ-dependent oxidase [Amycolatopsis sp. NPDC003865]
MAVIAVRIHPAIGIARVGDSEKAYFIGPERSRDLAVPDGGRYRDSAGRIKRQAARFRVFAHHDDGRVVELTSADADIEWTVHLANRKAVASKLDGRGGKRGKERNAHVLPPARNGLIIDSGPRAVSGRDRADVSLDGTFTVVGQPAVAVRLGDASTDRDGRLVVKGGRGKAGSPSDHPLDDSGDVDEWYDDVSDGPVSATVRIGGTEMQAERAWVIVCPPSFAPAVGNVVRLWDALFDALAGDAAKALRPSYVRDIYPILQAANDIGAVNSAARGRHRFRHPVTAAKALADIRRRVTTGGAGHMPKLTDDDGRGNELFLTGTQLEVIRRWAAGDFTDDWPTGASSPPFVPDVTPEGLDRAALENCVGGALGPGIEAGKFLLDKRNFVGDLLRGEHPSFRLGPDVEPGAVTAGLSVPWQGDLHYCRGWWAEVPEQVMPFDAPPGADPVEWARGAEELEGFVGGRWAGLGFVTRRGDQLVETERVL